MSILNMGNGVESHRIPGMIVRREINLATWYDDSLTNWINKCRELGEDTALDLLQKEVLRREGKVDDSTLVPLIERYQDLIQKTAIYPKEIGIAYATLGLTGEAGEIANKVKKMYRDKNLLEIDHTDDMEGYDQVKVDMKAELGDVMWYVVALAQEFGLTLEEIMEYNISKLLGRRERGTLSGSGDNR